MSAMTETKKILSDFVVSPYANQGAAVETDNGMLNMGSGMPGPAQAAHTLVIQPGGRTAARIHEMRREIQGSGMGVSEEAEASAAAAAPQRKSARRRKAAPAQEPLPPRTQPAVNISVTVQGLGSVPSQYRHVYFGDDTVVLGLNDLSYIPAVVTASVELSVRPGELYVNSGYGFVDASGVRNIIMIKVPNE